VIHISQSEHSSLCTSAYLPATNSSTVCVLRSAAMVKRVAVILSGCGVYDGSEVHESSAVLVHLSRAGAKVRIRPPRHIIDCRGGRNGLIVLGSGLGSLSVGSPHVLPVPSYGGFARLSPKDMAPGPVIQTRGVAGSVLSRSARNLDFFHSYVASAVANRGSPKRALGVTAAVDPPALLCSAPRWPYAGTAAAVKEMGCKHVNRDVGEVHVDAKNKLVTTSAFMCNAPLHQIFDGIGVMVADVLKMA
uniref:Si:ch211-153b23.5 n=1 Tax=Lepisosteus oculatus TaxID=7918 RepID=W5NCF7_LEPOC